uniref:WAP domain-containing protein n=1 Tax=Trichuris muris TaxID=70415 RepID=A0A5S6QBY6_TRIMR
MRPQHLPAPRPPVAVVHPHHPPNGHHPPPPVHPKPPMPPVHGGPVVHGPPHVHGHMGSKPGRCQIINLITLNPQRCARDSDCPGNQKCCNVAGTFMCDNPVF